MSVNSSRSVDMHAFVWEYRLVEVGRGCARTAQLDDSPSRYSVVAHHRYERASPVNCGQPLQKVNGGLSEPFEPLYCRKIDHSYQSRRTRHVLVTGHTLVTRKLLRIHMSF